MREAFHVLKRLWMGFARALGRVNTVILLTIVYALAIGIMSLIVKIFRRDLLSRRMPPSLASYWLTRTAGEQTLERHKYQF